MKKIKILHITQAAIGGTATYIMSLIKNFDKDIFENVVICPQYGDLTAKLKNAGVNVFNLDMKREISLFSDIKHLFILIKYIGRIKPDIIYLHSSKAGALGRVASLLTRIPCIYNPHGWSFDMDISYKKRYLYSKIEKILALFTCRIINISKHDLNLALKNNISSSEKLILIENAIDTNCYKCVDDLRKQKEEIKKILNIPVDKKVIGMLARITKQKNPRKFICICEELNRVRNDLHFVLIGDGELRHEIEKLIKLKKLNNISISGWCDEDKLKFYLSVLDVGILTSDWEGFGLAILEYMVCKIPVVASKVGGIVDIIDHKYDGFLATSVDEFVEYINLLLNDSELRKIIIHNAYNKVISKYDIRRLIEQHQILIFEVLNYIPKLK